MGARPGHLGGNGEHMSYEHILVDMEDGVGILTLNRPDKLNAMNRKLSARAARRGQGAGRR